MAEALERIEQRFSEIVGRAHVKVHAEGVPDLLLDRPVLDVSPSTVEQMADAIRLAHAEKWPVIPTGNGSALYLGNVPADACILLSTRRLSHTIDFEPRDLTAVVEAGKPLQGLQHELGAAGQFLALDPPNAERATVGGLVATNASGPLRRGYGTPRDLCIGLKAILADGTLIRTGGRVVKNVAGYDVTRLLIGSFGTLAVLVEAAFRLHPLPETEKSILAVGTTWEDAIGLARRIVQSETQPSCIELLDLGDGCWGEECGDGPAPSVFVGFGGAPEAVDYQVRRIGEMLSQTKMSERRALEGDEAARWRKRVTDVLDSAHRDDRTIVFRVSTVMSAMIAALETMGRFAQELGAGVQSIAHYGNGVLYSLWSLAPSVRAEAVAAVVARLREAFASLESRVVVESAPVQVKRALDVWGAPTGPLDLMKKVKDRFDPDALLNRGRFLRGLEG